MVSLLFRYVYQDYETFSMVDSYGVTYMLQMDEKVHSDYSEKDEERDNRHDTKYDFDHQIQKWVSWV